MLFVWTHSRNSHFETNAMGQQWLGEFEMDHFGWFSRYIFHLK